MAESIIERATLMNPEASLGLPDFCDWRVFAVPHTYSDSNVSRWLGADDFTASQGHNGPAFIWVGANVTDERLARHVPALAERYRVTLEQLQAARAGELVPVRIECPSSWSEAIARSEADLRAWRAAQAPVGASGAPDAHCAA